MNRGPEPIHVVGVAERDQGLVAERWDVRVDVDASAAAGAGTGDDSGVAAVVALLEAIGLTAGDVDDVVARAAADGVGAATDMRAEHVVVRRSTEGWWQIAVRGDHGDPAPTIEFRARDGAEAADRVLSAITRRRLYRPVPAHLHGGAVARADGAAALVLGPSGTGKSTMVAHLAAAGLDLLNDEQVALHPARGVVGGFTRPLACKPASAVHFPEPIATDAADAAGTTLVTAARLGARHRLAGRPVLVVVAERDESTEPAVEPLDRVSAAQALAQNNLDLLAHPHDALDAFGWLVTTAAVVRVRYRASAQGAALVRELLADPPDAPRGSWWVRPQQPVADVGAGMLAPARDAVGLGFDDGALLLNTATATAVTCNAAAAELWASLPAVEWPDDGESHAFVAGLRDAGLVESAPG